MSIKYFLLISMLLTISSCKLDAKKSYRRAAHSGTFYPGQKERLKSDVNSYITNSSTKIKSLPRAFIVPHAGYSFSGKTAGYAFNILKKHGGKIKRVILLAPSHYAQINGVVVNTKPYVTPLGIYPLDNKAIKKLLNEDFPREVSEVASTKEHSDEVEIPFLQEALPDAKLVPIVVGNINNKSAVKIATAISNIIDKNTVLLVSSDFTHYGSNFGYLPKFKTKDVKKGIKDLDLKAINKILEGDYSGFSAYLKKTGITICGRNPIKLLLKIFEIKKWKAKGELLDYTTSGDMTSNWSHTVSYSAIALGEIKNENTLIQLNFISKKDQKTLLKLSRFVLTKFIKNNTKDFTPELIKKFNLTPPLKKNFGVFVTLNKKGHLRGCIGSIIGREPLYEGVIQNTMNAAAHDPRFNKVNKEELKELDIEISVLSPLEKVNSLDDILVGRDGVLLKSGYSSSVFLPQVPIEWNWDKKTYLERLSRKAGLPKDAYTLDKTELYKFGAQVFHEEK